VAFETGFYWTQIKDAAVYLFPRLGALQGSGIASGLNGFETLLYRTTAGAILADAAAVLPSSLAPDLDSPIRKHRDRVLFTLDSLERMPSPYQGQLVFAHVVSPHEPFVFRTRRSGWIRSRCRRARETKSGMRPLGTR
jgi:hypothetical protein